MRKSKLLTATALTGAALIIMSCRAAPEPETSSPATPNPASVETLVTDAVSRQGSDQTASSEQNSKQSEPTVQEAKEFLEDAEKEFSTFASYASKVSWVNLNALIQSSQTI